MSAVLRFWNGLEISQLRQRRLPPRLLPHVPKGGRVLDVGSGNGHIGACLLHDGQAALVQGVDVVLQPDPHIPTMVFDGESLPFDDQSFDLVTLVDVLHHCDHPQTLLREAMRVSRQRIVIKDHYWLTRLDRWVLAFSDYLGNKAYGISLPYNFLRLEQWDALFAQLGLAIVCQERFTYARHDMTKQVIFVVEPIAVARRCGSDDPPG
ncbi:MAG: class I SAM-dependent methyltransferase [Magnetospirillum sp.]